MVNPLNFSGVGELSGIIYRGTGMSQGISTVHNNEDGTYTSLNNFYLIGQGPGNNLVVHSTFHITANQDGTNVIMVENSFEKCQ